MRKTKPIAIFFVLLSTIIISVAQVFYKFASQNLNSSSLISSLLLNPYLFIGLAFYGIAALLLIFSLKNGEVSTIYPMIAASYLWVFILSNYFFDEAITPIKLAGVGVIILGITVLGASSK